MPAAAGGDSAATPALPSGRLEEPQDHEGRLAVQLLPRLGPAFAHALGGERAPEGPAQGTPPPDPPPQRRGRRAPQEGGGGGGAPAPQLPPPPGARAGGA